MLERWQGRMEGLAGWNLESGGAQRCAGGGVPQNPRIFGLVRPRIFLWTERVAAARLGVTQATPPLLSCLERRNRTVQPGAPGRTELICSVAPGFYTCQS